MIRTQVARGFHPRGGLAPALCLALSALVVSGVRAQQPTVVQPATPQPPLLPLNQPVAYGYTDAQGSGTLTLTDIGADPATGGRLLRVSIAKGTVQANGSGLSYLLADQPPAPNNLITFSVVAPNGTPLFYQVKVSSGGQFQGQGSFHTVADPTQLASWTISPLQLALSRNYISFSSARLGTTAGPICFTITNPTSQPVFLTSITVQNCSSSVDPTYINCATTAGFRISSGDTPGYLLPGQSRDVCVTFSPGELATFDAHVLVSTNLSNTPTDVQLHGTGDPP
jgi:hypothetical protein